MFRNHPALTTGEAARFEHMAEPAAIVTRPILSVPA